MLQPGASVFHKHMSSLIIYLPGLCKGICVSQKHVICRRGFIMGVWNSHTSVGNILGSLIAGAFVNHSWGWSFVVPGIIIGSFGVFTFLFLPAGKSVTSQAIYSKICV